MSSISIRGIRPRYFFVSNTNLVELRGLFDEVTHEIIDDANVLVTIVDAEGEEVSGQVWPATMVPTGSALGDYHAVLSENIEFEVGARYIAIIDVDAGDGRKGHWELWFFAMVRDK